MKIKKTAIIAGVALVLTGSLASCSSDEGTAADTVRDYVEAVAAGDAELAHELNPYSPILSKGAAVASGAAEHITVVKIGRFDEVETGLELPEAPEEPAEPAEETDDDTGWVDIDWDDQSWTGLEGGDDVGDAESVVQGIVPVTYAIDDTETTVPIGVAYGRDDTGKMQFAFRSFPLGQDQAARYGADQTAPALAPASVLLDTSVATGEDEETERTWWGGSKTKEKDEAEDAVAPTRAAVINGGDVQLSEETPLLLLPGSYEIALGEADDDAMWASPGIPDAATVALAPGEQYSVQMEALAPTELGKEKTHDDLEELAQERFAAITTFITSDRGQSCGMLAPTGRGGSGGNFEDDVFHVSNTNIAAGAIEVTAKSDNGATGSARGNGSTSDTFADEAFCTGTPDGDVYSTPVEVLSSSMTPGVIEVEKDGTFTTTTPWTMTMTTTVSSREREDAAGNRTSYNESKPLTTYEATVNITWSPTGSVGYNGDAIIEPHE